jgi:hypothetical protein
MLTHPLLPVEASIFVELIPLSRLLLGASLLEGSLLGDEGA